MRIHAFHLILEEWFLNIIISNCISFVLFVHSGDDEFDDFPDTESPGEIILTGHFDGDNIWLQLPEFISFLISYSNFSIPLRI